LLSTFPIAEQQSVRVFIEVRNLDTSRIPFHFVDCILDLLQRRHLPCPGKTLRFSTQVAGLESSSLLSLHALSQRPRVTALNNECVAEPLNFALNMFIYPRPGVWRQRAE
jgi:hypothetical protein